MKWNVSNVQERGQRRLEWEGVSSVRVGLHEALMWELSCSEQGSGHKEKDSTWQVQSMADSGHGCMQWGKVDGMVVWIGGSMVVGVLFGEQEQINVLLPVALVY